MLTTSAPTARVLIVNDNTFELATMAASLRQHCISVVGEAANSFIAENLFQTLLPDVVIVELQESGEASIHLLQQMRRQSPHLGIVITLGCPDLRLFGILDSDLPGGAQIVLTRNMTDITIITDAIKKSRAEVTINGSFSRVNVHGSEIENGLLSLMGKMTNVQVETLKLVARGLSNSEIAKVRFVSEKSVEQIVARIAQHLSIFPDRKKNLRVVLVGEYFKWLGAPRL